MSEKVLVGEIGAAYGIKGWVKVHSHTEPREQIFSYGPWYLKQGLTLAVVELETCKKHNKGLVVLPKSFDTRNQAESISGCEVWVDSGQLVELADGEYYWHQLEGLDVVNERGQLLGAVSHLMQTGANDVLVLRSTHKSIDDRERLIPYVASEFIVNIDLAAGSMRVKWDAEY